MLTYQQLTMALAKIKISEWREQAARERLAREALAVSRRSRRGLRRRPRT